MAVRIKKGDTVLMISGRQKGERGEVLRVLPTERRVVVQGVNLRKKHQRQVQAGSRKMNPGIIQFEAPIDVSKVMLICPSCKEPARVGVRREDGVAKRVCKNCQTVIER